MDYNNLSVIELREIAKDRGLKGITTLKKSELIEALISSEPKKEKTQLEIETDRLEKEIKRRQSKEESSEDRAFAEFKAKPEIESLDSGIVSEGILEVMADGYGFLRTENY